MKPIFQLALILLFSFFTVFVNGQSSSANKVRYMITYDESESLYTAWVVPSYSTPNFNNPDSEEKGATAQFSIKVPQGFVMSSFTSLTGSWEGYNSKIGSEPIFKEVGLDTGFEYYILGKSPTETNYGVFEAGEPVALFSFSGVTQNPSRVAVIDNDDVFVDVAYNKLSLNVAASFYSRSGQTAKSYAKPLEQFLERTDIRTVVNEAAEKLGATESLLLEEADASNSVLVYPNPSDSIVHIKYFSLQDGVSAQIELVDQNGSVLQEKTEENVKRGFNTAQLDISEYAGSMYFAKITINNRVLTQKVIKAN